MTVKRRETANLRQSSSAVRDKAAGKRPPRVALAIQGSFGHIDYAAGLLDAFRAHNHGLQDGAASSGKPLDIVAASGCVEMLTPLWLYLADQKAKDSLRAPLFDSDKHLPPWARQRIAPPAVRQDAWRGYLAGLSEAHHRFASASLKLMEQAANPAATAEVAAAWQNFCMFGSGLPGQLAFNPFFTASKAAGLAALCASDAGPTVFTNATRARDFQEIYLYSGATPNADQQRALTGKGQRRQALRMTPEYFFASGARPPYIAPMPVTVDGQTEHWMEGAMRCNPPLVPLIDMDATHILLLRFFSKDVREEPNNHAELNERFLDAIFSIPLQKEIESIELNNQIARCMAQVPPDAPLAPSLRKRREVTILDPADGDNIAASPAYIEFLSEELTALSHYDGQSPARRAQLFERGFEVGAQLIRDLQAHLP